MKELKVCCFNNGSRDIRQQFQFFAIQTHNVDRRQNYFLKTFSNITLKTNFNNILNYTFRTKKADWFRQLNMHANSTIQQMFILQ